MNQEGKYYENETRSSLNLQFMVILIFVTLPILAVYADIMTQQMFEFDQQQVAGVIAEGGNCEIKKNDYLQKETIENQYYGSVNDLVSEAKTYLQQFYDMVEHELQQRYDGGFYEWRSVVLSQDPFRTQGTEWDEGKNTYFMYGQEMSNFNSLTASMITNRQNLGSYVWGTMAIMATEAGLFMIPNVGTSVVLYTLGGYFYWRHLWR